MNTEFTQKELELKELELILKKKELENLSMKNRRITIEMSTIIVAIIAFIGSFLGNILQGYNKQQQQRQEFESTLIINAVQTGNSDISKNNLRFLLDANLITDNAKEIKLKSIIRDSNYKIQRGVTSESDVYICTDPKSVKYHISKNCRALDNCKSEILQVKLSEAIRLHHGIICSFEN